jgi:5-methylcytosine-specific restriction endonuclease McrA
MEKQILELRAQGKTYKEIMEVVGCSNSTVAYYCGEGQKEKTYLRNKNSRSKIHNSIKNKIVSFLTDRHTKKKDYSALDMETTYNMIFNTKVCYLSGRKIDLTDTGAYHLDHIIPFSKGGKSDFDNIGVTCKEANIAKSTLSIEDFILLCVDVCKHNGYNVEKQL